MDRHEREQSPFEKNKKASQEKVQMDLGGNDGVYQNLAQKLCLVYVQSPALLSTDERKHSQSLHLACHDEV